MSLKDKCPCVMDTVCVTESVRQCYKQVSMTCVYVTDRACDIWCYRECPTVLQAVPVTCVYVTDRACEAMTYVCVTESVRQCP